jgi:hypothetical protein
MGFEENLHWNDWQKLKNMDFHWNGWEVLIEQTSMRLLARDSLRGCASCTRASLESARRLEQCHLVLGEVSKSGILQVASLADRVTFSKDYQIRWFCWSMCSKSHGWKDSPPLHHLRLETWDIFAFLSFSHWSFQIQTVVQQLMPWCWVGHAGLIWQRMRPHWKTCRGCSAVGRAAALGLVCLALALHLMSWKMNKLQIFSKQRWMVEDGRLCWKSAD